MKITKVPDGKRFSEEDEEEEEDEDQDEDQEEGRARLITPQIFPTTPIPLPPGPKTLRISDGDPFSITRIIKKKVSDGGDFGITIKKK